MMEVWKTEEFSLGVKVESMAKVAFEFSLAG